MVKRRINDSKIIKELRRNSRESIKELALKTGISSSTIKNKIKNMEKKGIIRRYTSVADFDSLNLIRAVFFIKGANGTAESLKKEKCINNMMHISNHYNLFIECIFPNIKEYVKFKNQLEKKNVEFKDYFVTEEIKREDFLANEDNR